MAYQSLVADCERCLARNRDVSLAETLVDRLEAMLGVVEEGIQLLSTSIYVTESSLVEHIMRSNLQRYLCLVMYGFNDTTVPPVAVFPYSLHYSRSAGRPKILLNIDAVELLRSCGYTWNEVANALQVSMSTFGDD